MAEYISREEAIKELREVYEQEYPTASGNFDEYASHDVPNVLKNMPAADVQPVRYGKWEGVDHDTFFKCSECGHMTDWQRYKYCPYCGARMDGEQNENN